MCHLLLLQVGDLEINFQSGYYLSIVRVVQMKTSKKVEQFYCSFLFLLY